MGENVSVRRATRSGHRSVKVGALEQQIASRDHTEEALKPVEDRIDSPIKLVESQRRRED